jgi:hypothetical protein
MVPESHPHFLLEPGFYWRSNANLAALCEVKDEVRFGNIGKIEQLKEAIEGCYPVILSVRGRDKEAILIEAKLSGMETECRKKTPGELRGKRAISFL